MKETLTLQIDLEGIKEEMVRIATTRIVNDYLDANDLKGDWDDRDREKKKRLQKIVGQVDWNKLPETMQKGILEQFMQKFIGRY